MNSNNTHKHTLLGIRLDLLICLFLGLFTLAVYWQVENHEFLDYDDNDYITENHHIMRGVTFENMAWAFTAEVSSNWHPLTLLSHMLDCQLYGLDSGSHHVTNLFFHITNTLLLFFVLKRMTDALWQSAFVAALFALHPLHVESVAWIAERKDVLSTFFWILTMWCYVRYVDRPRVNRYLLVVLFFMLGLMTKPMLVTLPFVLLLLDYWPLKRFQFRQPGKLRLILEKLPLLVLSAASCFLTYFIQHRWGAVEPLSVHPLTVRIANVLISYIAYMGKMIWPFHLAVLYPYSRTFPWWQVSGACLLLVFISLVVIRTVRQRPYLAVGWLWYMGTLVPVIGLVQVGVQAMADRYTYVPFIGLFIAIAWGVPELVARWRHRISLLACISSATLLLLMILTWMQLQHWKDGITVFEHAVHVTNNNMVGHAVLATALISDGQLNEAVIHLNESLRINSEYAMAHNNLGVALTLQGRTAEAIRHYSEALRINPRYSDAYKNLNRALSLQGNR